MPLHTVPEGAVISLPEPLHAAACRAIPKRKGCGYGVGDPSGIADLLDGIEGEFASSDLFAPLVYLFERCSFVRHPDAVDHPLDVIAEQVALMRDDAERAAFQELVDRSRASRRAYPLLRNAWRTGDLQPLVGWLMEIIGDGQMSPAHEVEVDREAVARLAELLHGGTLAWRHSGRSKKRLAFERDWPRWLPK